MTCKPLWAGGLCIIVLHIVLYFVITDVTLINKDIYILHEHKKFPESQYTIQAAVKPALGLVNVNE